MSIEDVDDYKTGASTAVNSTDDAYMSLTHTQIHTPSGWTRYIHPQSWAYFRNDERKLVVDDDLRKPEILAYVNEYYLANPLSTLPDGVEASLLGSAGSYFYLIVDHNQCVAEHASDKLLRDWAGLGEFSLANRTFMCGLCFRHVTHAQQYSAGADCIGILFKDTPPTPSCLVEH